MMANIRKPGYFKPAKPNNRAWDRKRRARPREKRPVRRVKDENGKSG